jgi:hypothetical protein
MSEPLTLPSPEQLAERIRSCRTELQALRRLYRTAVAAEAARAARASREQYPLQQEAPHAAS